ncbi:MAG TPA: hypothetical protein VFA59_05700 [Vicinamibacterales bacterium]|nr:hypothetical protein [Vicinamibacterales bacterium]
MPQLHHHAPPVEILSLVQPVEIFVMPGHVTTTDEAVRHIQSMKHPPAPTDIIVIGNKAGHYHGGVIIEVHSHKHGAHDPTVVRLSPEKQDMILWYCERHKFSIYDIKPDPDHAPDAAKVKKYAGPNNPFYRELPFGKAEHYVVSGPVQPHGANGFFKVVLNIDGVLIDPHIET